MHAVSIALVVGSHGAASSSRSSFDAPNIKRLVRQVNEMAIHICASRTPALLLREAPADGFISR
jgi:hypothetical protein